MLVLPPRIAPFKVVLIPIGDDEKVTNAVNEIKEDLSDSLITYKVDDSLKSPGFKFAEAEIKGYPVRNCCTINIYCFSNFFLCNSVYFSNIF